MQKIKFTFIFLAAFFIFSFFSFSHAKQIISPFGDLDWEDNVINVIKKLSARKGIEKLKIEGAFGFADISLNGNDFDIKEKLSAMVKKVENRDIFYSYKDHAGDKLTLANKFTEDIYKGEVEVIASPIIISNVPFRITAKFLASMGYMERNKETLVVIKGNKGNYYLPYYLQEVVLSSQDFLDQIPSELLNNIRDIIFDKYKMFLSEKCMEEGKVYCKHYFEDKKGKSELVLRDTGNYFKIIYKNNFTGKELNKLYKKHLKSLSIEKHKNKKDSSGDL